MRAMVLQRVVSLAEDLEPLTLENWPIPEPGNDEVLIRVVACGVCHTELDQIEGRLTPTKLPVIPGHQAIGYVDAVGSQVTRWQRGDRVGVGWIHGSDGSLQENLSDAFRATGRDADGGYAEYLTIGEDYAFAIPDRFRDVEAAPLLCAGAIGYRALRLANVQDGDRLGLMGFGGSAHLVLQLSKHLYPNSAVFVFARDISSRQFALELGADWSGGVDERAPRPLHAIIDTTPAWKPMVESLANLRPGGRLVINAIRKESADQDNLLSLQYHEHLWMEREIKSVANITQHDIREFLPLAAAIPLRVEFQTFPLERANDALRELQSQNVRGSKVLVIAGPSA